LGSLPSLGRSSPGLHYKVQTHQVRSLILIADGAARVLPARAEARAAGCTRCSRSCRPAVVQEQYRPSPRSSPDQTRPDQTDQIRPEQREAGWAGTVLHTRHTGTGTDRHRYMGRQAQAQAHRLTDSLPRFLSPTRRTRHTTNSTLWSLPELPAAGKEDRLSLGAKPFNFQPVFSRRTTHAASHAGDATVVSAAHLPWDFPRIVRPRPRYDVIVHKEGAQF
jgi:hypothetical protein